MHILLEILKYTLPSLITAGFFFLITKQFILNEQKQSLLRIKENKEAQSIKIITPIRLQAYERLILFLERMNPNQLVLRSYHAGMGIKELQSAMVQNIRDEFDHNLSQQMYISSEAWNLIKNAKEEMINLINSSAIKLEENSNPLVLAGTLFEQIAIGETPSDRALSFLKNEIHFYFR